MNDAPQRLQDMAPETGQLITQVIGQMPDLPLSVSRIIDLAADIQSSLHELANLASSDPALVSSILKVVNSSYYGLGNKTDSLHLAIVLLGFREIRQITMQCFIRRTFGNSGERRAHSAALWEHSYLVSVAAESLVPGDDQQRRGVYMTLGLLHDIGKYVLFNLAALMRDKGIDISDHGAPGPDRFLLAREEHLYGVNHTIVGALLAEKWNLSERFTEVLKYHHTPSFQGLNDIPGDYTGEISAICIADLMVNTFCGVGNHLPEPHPHFFELLGLEPSIENLLTSERRNLLDNARAYIAELQ